MLSRAPNGCHRRPRLAFIARTVSTMLLSRVEISCRLEIRPLLWARFRLTQLDGRSQSVFPVRLPPPPDFLSASHHVRQLIVFHAHEQKCDIRTDAHPHSRRVQAERQIAARDMALARVRIMRGLQSRARIAGGCPFG